MQNSEEQEEIQEGEEKKEITPKSPIRQMVDDFYQIQEHRIAVSLQRQACERAKLPTGILPEVEAKLLDIEAFIKRHVEKQVKSHPMGAWLKKVKGIGPLLAGSLLATLDPAKAPHASCYWSYAGLSVDPATNTGVRRKKGEKITWNPFLKTTCFKIGQSFVKTKGEWRQVYDTSKAFYKTKFPEEVKEGNRKKYTKGHIDAMARRRTVKLFLARLWEESRIKSGLPVSVPFAERIGVHESR